MKGCLLTCTAAPKKRPAVIVLGTGSSIFAFPWSHSKQKPLLTWTGPHVSAKAQTDLCVFLLFFPKSHVLLAFLKIFHSCTQVMRLSCSAEWILYPDEVSQKYASNHSCDFVQGLVPFQGTLEWRKVRARHLANLFGGTLNPKVMSGQSGYHCHAFLTYHDFSK